MAPPSDAMIQAAAQLPIAPALVVAATPPAVQGPTSLPKPPPQQPIGFTVENENRIVDQLLQRLQDMGIAAQQPPTPTPVTAAAPAKAPPPPAIAGTEPEQEWNNQWWDPWNPDQAEQPRSQHSQQGDPGLESGSQGDQWNAWEGRRPTDWNDGNWGKNSWKDDRTEERDRPYLSHLDFPSFNGNKEDFATYRYTVLNLKAQCGTKDHKYLAPRLISNFKGAMSDDVRSMEMNSSDYLVSDGVELLLAFIRKRLNIRELDLETEAFKKYFNDMMRKRGETLTKYMNAEETAYRKLQRTLKEAMEGGTDEYSDDDHGTDEARFKLPKRLRGWLFMERAQIPLKEHSGILNMTQGLNIDKLKKVMTESFPDKILKDIDGRTATKAPWQRNTTKKKPFSKSEHHRLKWPKNMMKTTTTIMTMTSMR